MYTKGNWQILPCPDFAAYHPYHENRYVVEVDGKPEIKRGRDTRSGHWELTNGRIICSMRDIDDQKECAHLISAAPDLLEACKYVVDWHRKHDSGEGELYGMDFVTTCINAIRKATGK